MPRDIPVGNGKLLVTFDDKYQIRDVPCGLVPFAGAAMGEHALAASAFLGALGASAAVFLLARAAGRVTSVRLLLSGVAVGYALYAATSFLIFASGSAEGARSVLFWLLGSLSGATWDQLWLPGATVLACWVALMALSGWLDALATGPDTGAPTVPQVRVTSIKPGSVQVRVRAALERLPERERQLLLLSAEGYRYRDMAAALELHEASVGVMLARAKRAFREIYGASYHAP